MRMLPHVLVILAAAGLLIGLVVRLRGGLPTDPVFYWRGSMALLGLATGVQLIQIRSKRGEISSVVGGQLLARWSLVTLRRLIP
jgi:hypothetical protein